MVSRETRVVGTAALTVLVALALFGVVETTYGFPAEWTNLVAFVLIAVVGFALPQLYLARTDSSVSPGWRLRAVLLFFLLFGSVSSANATATERVAIWTLVVVAFVLVLAYEFHAGYLSTARESRRSRRA